MGVGQGVLGGVSAVKVIHIRIGKILFSGQVICHRWNSLLIYLSYWCHLKHNTYVIATVPKENLLVWNLKEGWEPLCKFLNKPIPSEPIPHDNRTGDKEFMERYILNKPIFKEVCIENFSSWPWIILRLEPRLWEK